jgi:hypothetical protein
MHVREIIKATRVSQEISTNANGRLLIRQPFVLSGGLTRIIRMAKTSRLYRQQAFGTSATARSSSVASTKVNSGSDGALQSSPGS